ncbi:MAG TPA: transposase [bacterium]|nr:transposase [bacterium]
MAENQPKRLTAPRLHSFKYTGPYAYFITICTYSRLPLLKGETLVSGILALLESACDEESFHLMAYCFMPDHLHLLVAGEEKSSLAKLVKRFKQNSSFHYRGGGGSHLWQRSYYDHVLRCEEEVVEVARYIWENPIRKGLVETISDYPFSGPVDLMPS